MLPLDVAAVFRDRVAEDVREPVAVVADETRADVALEGVVVLLAAITGGGTEHDAAVRIDAEVGTEAEAVSHGQVQAALKEGPERRPVAAGERDVGQEGLLQVLLEETEGDGPHAADAHAGAFGLEFLAGGIDQLVGPQGGDKGARLVKRGPGPVEGDGVLVARGARAGDVERVFPHAQVFDVVRAVDQVEREGVREQPALALRQDRVAVGDRDLGRGIVADLIRGQQQVAVGQLGVADAHRFLGVAVKVGGLLAGKDHLRLVRRPQQGRAGEENGGER